ncbi:MAG: tetratricopeptide repeat protein [Ignavibacteriae bacterium]|nr:tetratricopeptide repeat protein [Ignavibacteriota bacterium]
MKRYASIVLGNILTVLIATAQPLTAPSVPGVAPRIAYSHTAPEPPVPAENQDDPAYPLYREGYNLILEEQWDAARKQFSELLKKHQKSDYADDAMYWSAYALRHIDVKSAKDAYRKFIKDYPKSSYYDDAVADLSEVDAAVMVSAPPGAAVFIDKGREGGYSYSYSYGSNLRRVEREMKRLNRRLRWTHAPAIAPMAVFPPHEEDLDPQTKLKMEALYALAETKEDEHSFNTLKDVATNLKQPRPLREAALDALSGFTKFDILPIYLEIAKKDTSPQLQSFAIDYISVGAKDKNKSVDILVDLFQSLPKNRKEPLKTVFYSIAEIGNDRAVDFLTKVALSNENYDLRTDAVYYLGNIGGEKARSALLQILRQNGE